MNRETRLLILTLLTVSCLTVWGMSWVVEVLAPLPKAPVVLSVEPR